MPLLDLQRRLREIGRIRLGERKPGNKFPSKLDTFRFTSPDRLVIDAAAQHYGGTVKKWDAPAGPQWQVITTAAEIPCIVPPSDVRAFSQWYELWAAGGCVRRCDSQRELLGDQACLCNPDARDCQPTTRLSVILPDLPGLGVWRLESHGWYAAAELDGAVTVAQHAADQGSFLPARLLLSQRMVKRYDADGTSETHRFVVPVLDLGLTLPALTSGTGGTVAITSGNEAALPPVVDAEPTTRQAPSLGPSSVASPVEHGTAHLQAVPPPAPPASVRDQVTQLDKLRSRKPPAPLPDTGVDVGGDVGTPNDEQPPPPDSEPPGPQPPSHTDPDKMRRRIMAETRKTWPDLADKDREHHRHALGIIATYQIRAKNDEPPVHSVADMTMEERLQMSRFMADLRADRLHLERLDDDDEGHPRFRSWINGGTRTAHVTRHAVDNWQVDITDGIPEPEPDADASEGAPE